LGGWISASLLSGVLTNDIEFTNDPESARAERLIEERLRAEPVTELFIIRSEQTGVTDPEFRAKVDDLREDILALGPSVVSGASTYYESSDEALVSIDGHATLMPVVLAGTVDEAAEHVDEIQAIVGAANQAPGYEILVAGEATALEDWKALGERDMRRGESIGVLVALAVLAAVFGAVVAALLPIALAVAAIALAIATVALVGQAFDFSFFVTNMITMMGLAVGIDYSLFIVSRYREERAAGAERLDAVALAGRTASRAVLFSGGTVVLALTGMLIIPTSIFRALALGAIFVVVFAVAASLTLLPATLALLGDRVNAIRLRRKARVGAPQGGRFWNRVSGGVMARPVVSLVLSAGVLLAAGASYFGMDVGFSGVSTLPDDLPTKQAFQTLAEDFSGGATAPVEIVVAGNLSAAEVQGGIDRVRDILAGDKGFGPSTVETSQAGDLAVISAPVAGDPAGEEAMAAVDRVREEYVPRAFGGTASAEVLVGGDPAMMADFIDQTETYMPIVFIFVLGLSFLLLTVAFRSVVVPLKAIAMNLLSVGAAYGLIVLVFQKGFGAGVFGFQQVEAIEPWLPLFLFSILFGLSMDYHVFLLSRIRERFDHTGNNAESVAYGLRTTGSIITGAALIMVAVFWGFAAGDMVSFQQMGFGLGVAVLMDATIVRSVLVPSTMRLLGNANWYLPRWLEWLPRVNVEGAAALPEGIPETVPERPLVSAGSRGS
jgi:RND superfamily putative drug exporter